MLPPEDVTKIKNELKKLDSSLEGCTDSHIRVLIEIRIEQCRAKLTQAEKIQL